MSILSQILFAAFNKNERAKRRAFKQFRNGQFVSAALTCDTLLGSGANDPVILRILADIAATIVTASEKFKNEPDASAERALRKIRLDFATLLQLLPPRADRSSLENALITPAFAALMTSGLRNLDRNARDDAEFKKLRDHLQETSFSSDAPILLAAMLFSLNFEMPLPTSLGIIPGSVREQYCQFLLDGSQALRQLGETERCGAFLARAVALIHQEVVAEHAVVRTAAACTLVDLAANDINFLQAHFTAQNFKPFMHLRGELLTAALIWQRAITVKALPPRRLAGEKIRLGVFTVHFGAHTDAYFTTSHIDHLDRERFHIILYVLKSTGHALERHCISRADQFVVLTARSLPEQADRIRADDLDILLFGVNQTLATSTASLLGCFRLARTQIATVSSPVTTGLRHIDVMLSAADNEPSVSAQEHYTEQLWLMPGSVNVYAYQYDTEAATVSFTRDDLRIAEDTIVFFSGANFFKIIPELSLTWARILARVPNSILVLMPFNPNWTPNYSDFGAAPFVDRLNFQLAEVGVSADRLRLLDPVPARADVHRILAAADIYLDAYPFAGACSMLDPIILAVPPVVRCGDVGRSLHGAALARMAGIDEIICTTEEAYISTAIDLAGNSARRARIRAVLQSVNARQPPPYFDTRTFSSNVGQALSAIHAQYLEPYHALQINTPGGRRKNLQTLADTVLAQSMELSAMTDTGTIHALVKPYFALKNGARRQHVVDVGACHGELAEPFLADGWSADLFEPDPRTRSGLERTTAKYGSRCRIFGMAVSNSSMPEVPFHQSQTGLSGLGDSPFGVTEAVFSVPCTSLSKFYVDHNVKFVDFLKIDAEGFDFDVLASHDFGVMQPPLVMVEYGTHFASESLQVINQAITEMAAAGYGSVVFNYFDDGQFSQGNFTYRLTHILIDQPLPDLGKVAFGNILFYRTDDVEFLLTLHALLSTCRPRLSM